MYLRVDPERSTISLEEPGDCARFHVESPGADADVAGRVLEACGLGRAADDGHVWVSVDGVRDLAAGRVEPSWADDLAGMVAYASSKGWVDGDTGSLRAHVIAPA